MVQETRRVSGLSLDYIFHPGDTLAEILEDRKMTQFELALRTGVTPKHISSIVSGKKGVSVSFAKKLEYALGIEAQFWINLQSNYDREIFEYNESHNITSEEIKVLNNFKEVIQDFQNLGLMKESESNSESVLSLRKILHVSNLNDIPKLAEAAAFRIDEHAPVNPYVLFAWQRMCELYTDDVAIDYALNIQKLKESLDEIKQTMFKKPNVMINELKEILGKCGIIFDVVPNYVGAPVQGYVKNLNDKFLLCITLRGKYSDIFWFTLLHEIGHIIDGDIKNVYVDFNTINNASEINADNFAKNTLLNAEKYSDFVMKGKYNSIYEIKELANACNVQPFIVIGRLMKEGLIDWSDYSSYRLKYQWND